MARLLVLLLLLAPTVVQAEPGPCHTPRSATRSFLDNLQPDQFRPIEAVRCFERPSDMSQEALIHEVRRLKAVLDHRGLFVVFEDIPDEHDFKDDQGRARADLVSGFEDVHLRRQGAQWRFPATIVRRIDRLYRDTFSGYIEGLIQTMPTWLRNRVAGIELWQIFGVLGLALLAVLLGRLVNLLVRQRLVSLFDHWGIRRQRAVLATSARPLGVLAGVGLAAMLLPELRLPIGPARVITVALRLVAAFSAVVVLYRLVDLAAIAFAAKARHTESKMDDQIVVLVRKTTRVVVVAIGLVFVLQNLHIDVTGLLAGLGIGGLALALAAKDTAANLFGSLTLFIDAPFYVGDWIKSDGVEGTVMEIGLRSTQVRTFYDSVVTVPNSKLANSNIDNFTRRNYRRFTTKLSLTYDTRPSQLEAFVEGIRAIVTAHPDTRKDAYEVHFVNYADSWLEVMVYIFFQVPSWNAELQARHQVLIEIMRLAEDLGVTFAFPTQTLHVDTRATETAVQHPGVPDDAALAATVQGFGPGGRLSAPRGTRLTHGFWAQGESRRGDEDGG